MGLVPMISALIAADLTVILSAEVRSGGKNTKSENLQVYVLHAVITRADANQV